MYTDEEKKRGKSEKTKGKKPVNRPISFRVTEEDPYYEYLISLRNGERTDVLKKAVDAYFRVDPLAAMLEEIKRLNEAVQAVRTEQEQMRQEIRQLAERLQSAGPVVSVPAPGSVAEKPESPLQRRISGTNLLRFASISSKVD